MLYTEDEMKDMKRACELFEDAASQEVCYVLNYCFVFMFKRLVNLNSSYYNCDYVNYVII